MAFDKANSQFGEGGDRFVPVKLKIIQSDSLMTIERTYQWEYENDFVDTQSSLWTAGKIIPSFESRRAL